MKNLIKGILLLCCAAISTKTYTRPIWQHIATPHYDILFPDNITREAQRLANTLETVYLPIANTLHVNPARIPIILQNNPCIANGYITLGPPRKGVFYTLPITDPAFLMNNDWLNLLAVHELRHVAQFEYLSGLNMSSFTTPEYAWIMEGDAIALETALSPGGRGRSPGFSLLYKVNLLERGGFSYYKQMYGSLKHNIPDHYRLGYFMTTYLRRHYGLEAIRQLMLRDGFWQSLNPYAFHTRIQKLTGMSVTEVYKAMQLELKALWDQQLEGLQITPTTPISKRVNETYTDYSYPQATKDGVIVLKSGLGTPPQFVKIDAAGKEHIICTPIGLNPSIPFSVADDTIIWLRNETGRASNDNQPTFNTIQSYNIHTKRFKAIGTPDRYYAISLSPDGKKIAACLSTPSYNHGLRVLDADTGDILQQCLNPENHFYLTPSWSSDSQQVLVVTLSNNKATITRLTMHPHAIETLLPATSEVISNPVLHNGYLYYSSPYSGIDNIYVLHLKTQKRYQVTSSKYGAYHPAISVDGQSMLYNDFGKDGMDAVQIQLDSQNWVPLSKVEDRSLHYYEPLLAQEQHADVLATVPEHVYPVKKLKAKHRFPIYGRPSGGLLNPGVEIVKGDLLDNAEWVIIGWKNIGMYMTAPPFKFYTLLHPYTKFIWKAWQPIISLELGSMIEVAPKGKKQQKYESNNKIKKYKTHGVNYAIQNELCLELPFCWYVGEYKHDLRLATSYTLTIPLNISVTDQVITPYPKLTPCYVVQWSRMSAKSRLDLYSPWGQELIALYKHSLLPTLPSKLSKSTFPSEYDLQYNLYFPGLWKHNHIRLHTAYIKLSQQTFEQHNSIVLTLPFPERTQQFHRLTARLYYDFPLAYFDTLWPKRLATHCFYDYAYRPFDKRNQSLHAAGMSFSLDAAALPDLYLEFCFTHCITTQEFKFELIFSPKI